MVIKDNTVLRMGRTTDKTTYGQVQIPKTDYAKMLMHAKHTGLGSFSKWAYAVLIREMKKPVHIPLP